MYFGSKKRGSARRIEERRKRGKGNVEKAAQVCDFGKAASLVVVLRQGGGGPTKGRDQKA